MGKRKLTERQTERVRQQHTRRISRSKNQNEPSPESGDLGPQLPGTVIANFGANLEVESADGSVTLCTVRQNLGELVCGDEVLWCAGHGGGVVVASLPRRTLLARSDYHGQLKPVAANVDVMVVVIAPLPDVSENLLDSYLVAAQLSGVTPLIVINKIDLLDDAARALYDQRMQVYRRIGYDVLFVSTKQNIGLDDLQQKLSHRTSVIVGHSGVGKSSLLKALLPDIDVAIGDVSSTGLGKHTTTTARMYNFSDHARLIDSPGVRDFKLGHIDAQQAAQGFVEFHAQLGRCKFTDCRHTVEPGCAIRAALQNGEIDARRYASYCKLLQSVRDDTLS